MTTIPFKPPNLQRLYDEIAQSHPSLARGRVWCARCNAYKDVDVARCLRSGWPKCHGATMSIDSPEERKP
jgi:Zn finger protein HypA/HybF involved in hydrogenase expression